MTRTVGRAAAAAVLAALFGAVWTAVLYAWRPAFVLDFDRDVPRNLTGVYPPERDEAAKLTFAWTAETVTLRLPGLDRRAEWTLVLRVRGARAVAAENPELAILADGILLEQRQTTSDFTDVRVTIPARPARRGLVLGLRSSRTFVPGPADPRPLGVMLDSLALTPDRAVLVPRAAMTAASTAAAAMGAAIALLGVTAGSAIGGGVLLSAGIAAVSARGFGPFTSYPATVTSLGVWIAIALGALSLATQRLRGRPLRNTARFAAAFSAAALLLKLLVLLHPDMPVGDAMFHAHRFQGVLAGNFYFTSVAPGGYLFPYPPGLYVFASLFASTVRRGASDMALLRVVTASVDALAGLLIYTVVVKAWGNRLAGAMAAALYTLVPVQLAVLTTGNLTNAFAQSVATGAFVLMGLDRVRLERWGWTLALAAALAVAYLSHTGTLAILFAATVAIVLLFLISGGRALRSAAAAIAIATLVAAALAVAVYYAHFIETYRTEFARIGRETAAAASDAGGRTIGDRLRFVPYSVGIYLGAPMLLFAFLGATELIRRQAGDRLSLALGGWAIACVLFLAIGIVTPVDMRYYLASAPAIAIAAGYGAAWAWNGGWPRQHALWRACAALFLLAAVATGFHNWWSTLG